MAGGAIKAKQKAKAQEAERITHAKGVLGDNYTPPPEPPKATNRVMTPSSKANRVAHKKELNQWKIDTGVTRWDEVEVKQRVGRSIMKVDVAATNVARQEAYEHQSSVGLVEKIGGASSAPQRDGGEVQHRGPAYNRRKRATARNSLRIR